MEAYDHETVRIPSVNFTGGNADCFVRTFVGPDFTRRPVKYERFIRPMGLRYKKVRKIWKARLEERY